MIVVVCTLVGWFTGAVVWNVARNQTTRQPLFKSAASDTGAGGMPAIAWSPLFGFLRARTDAETGMPQSRWRPLFEVAVATYFAVAAAKLGGGIELTAVLVFQGARSFELWTGREAPVELMMRAALEARGVS